jgi:predicted RND superfamily exporter protein
MMIAIANNYVYHIISRYRELKDLYPHEKKENLVKICVKYLKQPVVITGLTTIAGILGLATHIFNNRQEKWAI